MGSAVELQETTLQRKYHSQLRQDAARGETPSKSGPTRGKPTEWGEEPRERRIRLASRIHLRERDTMAPRNGWGGVGTRPPHPSGGDREQAARARTIGGMGTRRRALGPRVWE
ncbi:hypothetical protein MRX96_022927 [Rhipicephalus microplus]